MTREEEAEAVASVLPLAYQVARENRGPLGIDDARSVAGLAVVLAVRRFDPARGVKLATYIIAAVRNAVRNAKGEAAPVAVPGYAVRAWRAERAGRRAAGLSAKLQARAARDAGRAFGAGPLADDGRTVAGRPEATAADPDDLAALRAGLAALPELHRRVMTLRHGLDGGAERTLKEIGAELGVSRETIRRVERLALAHLREWPGLSG